MHPTQAGPRLAGWGGVGGCQYSCLPWAARGVLRQGLGGQVGVWLTDFCAAAPIGVGEGFSEQGEPRQCFCTGASPCVALGAGSHTAQSPCLRFLTLCPHLIPSPLGKTLGASEGSPRRQDNWSTALGFRLFLMCEGNRLSETGEWLVPFLISKKKKI